MASPGAFPHGEFFLQTITPDCLRQHTTVRKVSVAAAEFVLGSQLPLPPLCQFYRARQHFYRRRLKLQRSVVCWSLKAYCIWFIGVRMTNTIPYHKHLFPASCVVMDTASLHFASMSLQYTTIGNGNRIYIVNILDRHTHSMYIYIALFKLQGCVLFPFLCLCFAFLYWLAVAVRIFSFNATVSFQQILQQCK